MEEDVFNYLKKKYRYLNNHIRNIDTLVFISPHNAIIKERMFIKNLTQEIAKLEGYGLLNMMTQLERLKKLKDDDVFNDDIYRLFHNVEVIGDKVTDSDIGGDFEGDLEKALNIHKNLYNITCWFVNKYIDCDFEEDLYEKPIPLLKKTSNVDMEIINKVINKIDQKEIAIIKEEQDDKNDLHKKESYKKDKIIDRNYESEDAFEDLMIESIFNNENSSKKCLVQELARLKDSLKEVDVEQGEFTSFKRYMHIERDVQKELETLILKANDSNKAQLILVCGSVGDGKSHIISYFNNKYSFINENFMIYNDTTESLEPSMTSMDTLNEVLNEFSDEKLEESKQKIILVINLEELNNFIDSKYGEKFSILKKYVQDKKILETSIEDSSFDDNNSFQSVNFSDYHIFTLKDGKVHSNYIRSLIRKITSSSKYNFFYDSYKSDCIKCKNRNCCPIKANYELLSKKNVQNSIVKLLVECIIKNKITISTRDLLNFIYQIIIPRSYIDVNSPTIKDMIPKLSNLDYINSLMPNLIFSYNKSTFISEALNTIDPLNVKNEKVDDFIIKFNNSTDIMSLFKRHIDYPKGYISKIEDIDFEKTEDINIKHELLNLFIRSYYLCGKGKLFLLRDSIYENYISALYFWNRGEKEELKSVYDSVKNGMIKLNSEADKEQMNIFMEKNQSKYKISELSELKADTSNLPNNDETNLKKFVTTLKLKYKSDKLDESYELDVNFSLYKLLMQGIIGEI